jgi:hypothetical protein
MSPWRTVFLEKLAAIQFGKNFPDFSWNPIVRYFIHSSPPLGRILSHMNPDHILTPYSFQSHFNIIISWRLRVLSGLLVSLPTKILYEFFLFPIRATSQA